LDTFEDSKEAGKPWQIFAQTVVMGPQLAINFDKLRDFAPDNQKSIIDLFVQLGYANENAFLLRGLVAMALTNTSLNSDAWDGFSHERGLLLNGFQEKTNNPIVLGGDSHESWVYTLFEDGAIAGNPVAVNLNGPAVTSPGYGAVLGPLFQPVAAFLGGIENAFQICEDSLTGSNEGLMYAEISRKGFVAVKATKVRNFVLQTGHSFLL
jgi:alkaline phosphatase D